MQCPEDGLSEEIDQQIAKIKHKKNRYTLWKNITRLVLLVLGAEITLVSGWSEGSDDSISFFGVQGMDISEGHLILILSTIITLITAVEALFKFSDKSTTYGIMLFELRNLKRDICFDFERDPAQYQQNKVDHFNRYQEILKSQKELIEESQS